MHNIKITENKTNMKPKLIQKSHSDEKSRLYGIYKCPHCCNFFVARKSSVESGHTKSCGCLRRKKAQEMGIANKSYNAMYQPLGSDYWVVYFLDGNDKFIISEKQRSLIKKYTWYRRNRGNDKYDVYTKMYGKTVYLHDYLNDTAVKNGEQCDHINQEPRDNRECNTRNCTQMMNLLNREKAKEVKGKIVEKDNKFIVSFPYVGESVFDTMEEAEQEYKRLYEFTYTRSQEIAKEIETYEFTKKFHYLGGVLEEIDNLPENNIYKRWLKNIEIWLLKGEISEEYAFELLLRHIDEYKKYKREEKSA